nr:efflux RND transporter periplasmic adaptor subunit [uncultured Caproiciproducens sp.]
MKDKVLNMIKTHKKMCIVIASSTVLGVAILTTVLLYINQMKASQSTANYREYTVAKGNVTVGTSESGTVALDETTVTFPVDVTIDSVLVKVGYSVKTGESLVKLDQDSITDGTLDSRTKLAQAKLSLEQAVADQENKLKTAKLTYQTSRATAANAYTEEYLAKAEIQNNITSAKADLKEKQDDLAKYLALQKSYPTDYAKLKQLKKWRDDTETTKTNYSDQLTSYNDEYSKQLSALSSLKSDMNSKYAAWVTAKALDDDEGEKSEYDDAKDAYDKYSDTISSVVTGQKDLESKVSLYTAEYNNYSSAYDDYNETFKNKYGSSSTSNSGDDSDTAASSSDEIDSKVTSLRDEVKTAQFTLEKAQKSSTGSADDAEEALQSSLIDGSSAGSTYELTANQLAQAVTTQQATYDSLNRELADVNSAINGEGALTAPCDGIVVSVGYSDGSDVKAGETIVTIAKTSAVSMSVSLSEDDVTDLSIGQNAEISLTSYEGQTFAATIESIAASPSRSGSASVTYAVVAKMTDPNTKKVFVGMSGEVEFIKKQKKDVLYVSDQAVTFEDGISSVLVKSSDGTTKKTTVTTGFSNGQYVEITSGLKEGDTVLVESAVTK